MTSTPKLTPDQLSKNASLINAAHRAVVQANKTSIEKAIEAGTILKACKDSVGHGAWSKWLHDNCRDISDETARLYMRLADPENTDRLEAAAKQNGNAVADLSVRGAAKVLSKPQTLEQKAARAATRTAKKAEADAALFRQIGSNVAELLKALAPDEVFKALKDAEWDTEELTQLVKLLNAHLKLTEPDPLAIPAALQRTPAAPASTVGAMRRL
jgi:hypothetical protein